MLALFLLSLSLQNEPTSGKLVSLPFSRGRRVFTNREFNSGKRAFCVQEGLRGKPRILLDSIQDPYLSSYPIDPFSISDDGRYFVYFTPQIPHRFEEIHVGEVGTGKILPDVIPWTYLSDLGWVGNGFIYARYPKPKNFESPSPEDHFNEAIHFHRLGTVVDNDPVIFEDPAHPQQKYLFLQDFAHRWFHIHIFDRFARGADSSEWFSTWRPAKLNLTAIQPTAAPGRFLLCEDFAHRFIFYTMFKSPKGRIIAVDPRLPTEKDWKTIVPETGEEMSSADPVCGKLTVTYKLPEGGDRVEFRSWDGKFEKTLPVPQGDAADIQWCAPSEKIFFYSLQHGSEPKRYFSYRMADGVIDSVS